ncbi:MAG: DUF4175 family protein [Elusimicrobiota bacterium]|nr:DUF4175 family protein [Elusimicrobiota bacterium]
MIRTAFLKRMRGLHTIRMISAVAGETLGGVSYFLISLAVFSLVDFIFPLSFRIRRFALIILAFYVLINLCAGLIKIFKNAVKKSCADAGPGVLRAFELARNKDKLAALGISEELIDAEIKAAAKIIRAVPLFAFVSFNMRACAAAFLAGAVLFFNGVSAERVIVPRSDDIGRHLSVEMKEFAVKGEPWEILVRVKGPVRPEALLFFKDSPRVRRKLAGTDGVFSFRIERCFRPFKIRIRWKNLYSVVYDIKLFERPKVLSRKIRIRYPLYLNLEDDESSFGGFAAFPGTVAKVLIKSSRELESARIITVFNGREKKIPMKVSGDSAEGGFTAGGAGRWRAELLSREGLVSSGTVVWKVEEARDSAPRAYILSPGEDIVINESFSGIDIAWLAEDDFGIKEAFFCCSKNGAQPEKIKISDGYSRVSRGKWKWKLSQVLSPGDAAEYWVAAFDAGGAVGESRRFSVTLKDFLATHRQNMEKEEAVKEKVFAVYQKQAELNIDRWVLSGSDISRRQKDIENNLLSLAENAADCASRAEKDPLYSSFYASEYRGLQKALDELASSSSFARKELESGAKEGAFNTQDEIAAGLEKLSAFSEDLFKRSSMDNLCSIGRESAEIADKLDNFLADSPDAEKMRELTELTGRIEKLMRELAETVKNMPQNLPEEFVNSDSVKSMDFNSVQNAVSGLKEALSSGNLSSAIKRAKELLENLNGIRKSVERASSDVSPMSLPRGDHDRSLAEIIQGEKNIISSSEKFVSARQDRMRVQTAQKTGKLKAIATRIKETALKMKNDRRNIFGPDAARLSPGIYRFNKNVSGFAARFMDNGFDFESLLEAAGKELECMTEMELSSATSKILRATSSDIEDFFEIYRDTAVPPIRAGDMEYALELSSSQRALAGRAGALEKKLRGYSRKSAQFPTAIAGDIKSARRAMAGAAGVMEKGKASDSLVFQEKALYYLKKAEKGMNNFEFTPQGEGSSMPSFFPSSGRPGSSSGKSYAGTGFKKSDFPIPVSARPGYDAGKERLNEAMRGSRPLKYRDVLKEYYEQLLK